MDPFGKRVDIYLGASGSAVCPVTALLGFLAVRPSVTGQLFMWQDGKALSQLDFVAQLRLALRAAGIDIRCRFFRPQLAYWCCHGCGRGRYSGPHH